MAAEISSDVDSEAPTDTNIRVGVSRKKSQLRGWRAEISSDVDSEAPTDTKIRVGVSRKKSQLRGWRWRYPVTSIRRRRRTLRYESAYLARSRNWGDGGGDIQWRRFGGAGGDEDTSRRISQEVATEGMTGGYIQWRRFGGADGH